MKKGTFLLLTISIFIEMVSKETNWVRCSIVFLISYLIYSIYYNSNWNKSKHPLKKGIKQIKCKTGMRVIFLISVIFICSVLFRSFVPEAALLTVVIYEIYNEK